jgi:hypothetical protein
MLNAKHLASALVRCRRPRGFGAVFAFCLAWFLAANSSVASAKQETILLMVEQIYCEWCEAWNEDIGGIYDRTPEGKQAPLRRIDISEPMPESIEFKLRTQFTPTFILIHQRREIGRIEGYPGEHFFWPMLQNLLGKLPPGDKPRTPKGSS